MTIYELIELENKRIFDTKLFIKSDRLENYLSSRFDNEQCYYLLKFGHISFENVEVFLFEKEVW